MFFVLYTLICLCKQKLDPVMLFRFRVQTIHGTVLDGASRMWQLTILLPAISAQGNFFEGDILFKNETLFQAGPEMVLQSASLRWPRGVVPFAFDSLSRFTDDEKTLVRSCMSSIQAKTGSGCIDFVEVSGDRGGDLVLITSLGYGDTPGTG